MAGLIHFSSGKELEITEYEFRNISPKLNAKGIRTKTFKSGHIVPLNSTTIEYIEHVVEDEPLKGTDNPEKVEKGPLKVKESEKKKTKEEKMDEIVDKSNCKHEPEKLRLYVQHTAKGIRYFPVCSFCGKRERYVSESKIMNSEYIGTNNEKWNENDIANALPWIED